MGGEKLFQNAIQHLIIVKADSVLYLYQNY